MAISSTIINWRMVSRLAMNMQIRIVRITCTPERAASAGSGDHVADKSHHAGSSISTKPRLKIGQVACRSRKKAKVK